MVHVVVNRRKMKTSPEKAFQAIVECRKWPDFVPGCLLVEVIEEKGNKILRRMHSKIRNQVVKMKTESEAFPEKFLMKYVQIERPWPLKTNVGEWYVEKLDAENVEMFLIHRFTVKYSILGDLYAWLIIKKFYIYDHNVGVLDAFAHKLEQETLILPSNIDKIYQTEAQVRIKNRTGSEILNLLKNVSIFPKIFSPYQSVEIVTSTPNQLVFNISALIKRGVFTEKGKRFSWKSVWTIREEAKIIEFEEQGPEKPLSYLGGRWVLEEDSEGTRVSLVHLYGVDSSIKMKLLRKIVAAIAKKVIDKNSIKELKALKNYIENCYEKGFTKIGGTGINI
jgi:ribosome-associated toxin RatA of RatAB toxin-antitoxin module